MSSPIRFASLMRHLPVILFAWGLFAPAANARDSLGVFESWGAFRDPEVPRCYAIAQPTRVSSGGARWNAFATVSNWPKRGVRGQFHARLSREAGPNAAVYLSIGERRFALTSGRADAWSQDRQMDAAIIAAIRSAPTMTIEGRDRRGRRFFDLYVLSGAATAMDAAALGCARR